MAMQWSDSLKKDVVKAGVSIITLEGVEQIRTMNLIVYTGHSYVKVKLNYNLSTNKVYLDKSIMIPIPEGKVVEKLLIIETTDNFDMYGMYTIILEGDEIQSFPNGGALIIENIDIYFNFV